MEQMNKRKTKQLKLCAEDKSTKKEERDGTVWNW